MSDPRPGLLAGLGLGRRELRGWALYDWANSAFITTILQLFPIYFARFAAADLPQAEAGRRFALATTAGTLGIALLAPLLGAIADHARMKKRMLATFLALGVVATAALYLVGRGEWLMGLLLFVVGNIGVNGAQVFSDSLLPHIARPHEVDRVATTAFALGYLGGGLLFGLNILWIQMPELLGLPDAAAAMRLSFLSVAVWWTLFSVPLLIWVPEPRVSPPGPRRALLRVGLSRLRATLRELRAHRDAALFLAAFLIYSDGINTIVRMGTLFGTEMGIATSSLLFAVLMVQFVAVPCALAFGSLAQRIGPRAAILLGLLVYVGITVVGYRMQTAADFFVLAGLVALVQGGTQALSRSLFATLVPQHKTSEFFGFFGVVERFGGVLGPALFAAVISATGSGRGAILGLIVFFVLGALLLLRVDVERGRAVARAAVP